MKVIFKNSLMTLCYAISWFLLVTFISEIIYPEGPLVTIIWLMIGFFLGARVMIATKFNTEKDSYQDLMIKASYINYAILSGFIGFVIWLMFFSDIKK